jgi:hypothetical protein
MFDLTSAQIHLALNHLPVFAALFGAVVLAFAAATRRTAARDLGLGLMVFAGLSGLPAYFTGEGAEEIVEDRPGVSEPLIERHEDAAGLALGATLAAGAVAAAALLAVRMRREPTVRMLSAVALLGALVSTALMGRAAHLGGQIRHDEIRSASAVSVPRDTGNRRAAADDD